MYHIVPIWEVMVHYYRSYISLLPLSSAQEAKHAWSSSGWRGLGLELGIQLYGSSCCSVALAISEQRQQWRDGEWFREF